MTHEEILKLVDQLERLWVENYVAREYLKTHCNIADPRTFLASEAAKIPRQAGLYRMFEPYRLTIGKGLHNAQVLEKLLQSLQERIELPQG